MYLLYGPTVLAGLLFGDFSKSHTTHTHTTHTHNTHTHKHTHTHTTHTHTHTHTHTCEVRLPIPSCVNHRKRRNCISHISNSKLGNDTEEINHSTEIQSFMKCAGAEMYIQNGNVRRGCTAGPDCKFCCLYLGKYFFKSNAPTRPLRTSWSSLLGMAEV